MCSPMSIDQIKKRSHTLYVSRNSFMKIEITPDLVKKYCDIIEDTNPIHHEEDTIKYGDPVAPGILVTAMITRNPKPYWALAKLNVRYHNAVYIGDTIEIKHHVLKEKSKICVNHITISVGDSVKQTIEMTTIKLN